MTLLRRYWFTFASVKPYNLLKLGCGVTAYGYDDALNVLSQTVYRAEGELEIRGVIEDVDVSTLDENHVVANMNAPVWRGVWFPKGYFFPLTD